MPRRKLRPPRAHSNALKRTENKLKIIRAYNYAYSARRFCCVPNKHKNTPHETDGKAARGSSLPRTSKRIQFTQMRADLLIVNKKGG